MERFVTEDLGPALADYGGQLLVTGTPKRKRSGFFFEVTNGAKGWSTHHWSVLNNAGFPQWAGKEDWQDRAWEWLQGDLEAKGLDMESPRVQREWFGRWSEDTGTAVYPYAPVVNDVDELPPNGPWTYGLGMDLGVMALVVAAWSPHDPNLYYVHAEKHKRSHDAIVTLGRRALYLQKKYGITKMVADYGALGTHIISDLRTRFGLGTVDRADKTQKQAYQTTFASEMVRGLVKVIPTSTVPLVKEWQFLQQEEDGSEDKRGIKDCADAALYIWRKSRHYKARPRDPADVAFDNLSPEQKWEKKMEAHLERRTRQKTKTRENKPKPRGVSMGNIQGML